ncbi:MAG: alanine dehydrogenase, partial [Christiangramia sp.]|nr:alanine dehydrogenase [Christiangramia sp.]
AYIIDDVVHYCVANMPGAVPHTSTIALTNVTLPYVLKLAENGWAKACEEDMALAKGLNIVNCKIVCEPILEAFNWNNAFV